MKNNHHLPAQERWDLLDHNRVPTGKTLCREKKYLPESIISSYWGGSSTPAENF